jgi:hypothetical protein
MKIHGMEYLKILTPLFILHETQIFLYNAHCISLMEVLITSVFSCFLELELYAYVISCLHNVDATAWLIIRKQDEGKTMNEKY